jgi:hypothetical protein
MNCQDNIYFLFFYDDYGFAIKLLPNGIYEHGYVRFNDNGFCKYPKIQTLLFLNNIKFEHHEYLKDSIKNCHFISDFLYDIFRNNCDIIEIIKYNYVKNMLNREKHFDVIREKYQNLILNTNKI